MPVRLNKVDRLFEQQGKFSSGRVHFPKDAPFLPELLKELLSFPQSKTTDQVDSISQALAYVGSTYTLDHVS
jgi:phage terminase large subunit-like protein